MSTKQATYMIDESLTIPKSILLDLDNTILASRQTFTECWTNLCNKHAPRINGIAPPELLTAIYENIQWFMKDPERNHWGRIHPFQANREVIARAFHHLGVHDTDLVIEIADEYHAEQIQAIQPFPGAIETIRHFRKMGIQLALITNGSKRIQRSKIDKFKLGRFFDHILIEAEFGKGKPDKEVYLHTLNQLGTTPQEAWMIGDNLELDVAAPQRLGIFSIWNDFQHAGLPDNAATRPDKVIHSLSELAAYFDFVG